MTNWQITLEALQPISIATKRSAETQWDSTSHIAGSTWRGALAEQWKYQVGFDHPMTTEFIHESIFHDAFVKETNFTPVFYKLGKKSNEKTNLLTSYIKEGRFKTKSETESYVEANVYETKVLQNSAMGIEMSRTRESTTKGKLYTMASIAQGATFEATAIIDEEIVQLLAPNYELEIYIGKKRYSGYGKTKVTFHKVVEENEIENAFQKQQQFLGNEQEVIVVLASKSAVILYDDYLRPATSIKWTTHVQPMLHESLQSLTPKFEETWGLGDIRNGWNQLWNLPKPVEHVLQAGTSYIAKFDRAYEAQVLQAVSEILQKGIGEKNNEGFGQMQLAQFDISNITIDFSQMTMESSSLFNAKEESAVIEKAEKYAAIAKNNISLSQWQAMLELENIIDEIISRQPSAYIERRLKTDLRNKWKMRIGDKNLGEWLREDVHLIKQQYAGKANAAVHLYLTYIARTVRMNEKGAKRNG